ncbi:uncharacterized protein BDZ99DRAFT_524303 [Mytilinidion resinicola]|uniref:Uncharacterized protein n=1 Tax=Mytilinidion resinicola TaxID=574789 RepID=A0A6A6YB68_9PEZI|nr:uncharacterized protein BDZ99DRAFT_524303 [Mytilinidion resinicola]KAF2806076.1 hypothetical protein BDZ99DRAFT_524303 [Mytilinidion resinicola]
MQAPMIYLDHDYMNTAESKVCPYNPSSIIQIVSHLTKTFENLVQSLEKSAAWIFGGWCAFLILLLVYPFVLKHVGVKLDSNHVLNTLVDLKHGHSSTPRPVPHKSPA